jgi:hypothetical protein
VDPTSVTELILFSFRGATWNPVGQAKASDALAAHRSTDLAHVFPFLTDHQPRPMERRALAEGR